MEELLLSGGGLQVVPQITEVRQIVYLDFDGESTAYNGEILSLGNVEVSDSLLTSERIAAIVAVLNEKYVARGVVFVTEPPAEGAYSTVFVGKTSAFDPYGSFSGVAECIDKNNLNKSDNAFVMLDHNADNETIILTISHETDHLLGTLDHGGEGLAAYAAAYYTTSGESRNKFTVSSGNTLYVSSGGTATNTDVRYGGALRVSSGGTATIIFNPWSGTISSYAGAVVTYLQRGANIYYGNRASGVVSKWNSVSSLTVNSGYSAFIYSGGTAALCVQSRYAQTAGSVFEFTEKTPERHSFSQ